MPVSSGKLIITIVFCAAVTCSGYYLYTQNIAQQELLEQQKKDKEEQGKIKQEEIMVLQDLLDKYLQDFTNELKSRVAKYKENKIVLKDITLAYHYTTPEDAQQSYNFFVQDLAPSMRTQSNEIINIFQRYQENLSAELAKETSERKEKFQTQWNEMIKEQLKTYVNYFIKENDLLNAYEELLRFYVAHSKRYVINSELNIFIFDNPKDKKKQQALLQNIENIRGQKNEEKP